MPDDFFNQQQNQRKPRYAAGSDIDSIKTGYEVPEGGFGKKKDRSTLIAAIIGAILFLWILPQIFSITRQSRQPAETQLPQAQTGVQGSLEKVVTGEVNKDLRSYFYSSDNSKATVEAYITNSTNKAIYDITVTYTIKDTAENIIAEKTIDSPNELASGETGDYTTVIETPSKPTGKTTVTMYATYRIRYT